MFSRDPYDVVMQWQSPVSGPRQYLWTVHYQYEGTGVANPLTCELSSSPCDTPYSAPYSVLLRPVTV